MFVTFRGSIFGILQWQWRYVALFVVGGILPFIAAAAKEAYCPDFDLRLSLPQFPLAIVGGAIGIFVSFRTNSAYDRWWEGRKLWGRLVNTSRHLTLQSLAYLPEASAQKMVRWMIAYVHALRVGLRLQPIDKDADLRTFTDEFELQTLDSASNPNHTILSWMMQTVVRHNNQAELDPYRTQSLDESIRHLLDIQGGCERIKKTPFPKGYGYIAERLIIIFGFLLPFGLFEELGWVTVPLSVLVCMAFLLIGEVGRVLEDPFTMFWPALPLSALSKTIEINLRERLGETDLPPMPQPNNMGVLM